MSSTAYRVSVQPQGSSKTRVGASRFSSSAKEAELLEQGHQEFPPGLGGGLDFLGTTVGCSIHARGGSAAQPSPVRPTAAPQAQSHVAESTQVSFRALPGFQNFTGPKGAAMLG